MAKKSTSAKTLIPSGNSPEPETSVPIGLDAPQIKDATFTHSGEKVAASLPSHTPVDQPLSGLERIVALATKWQEPLRWTQALKAAKGFRMYRCDVFIEVGRYHSYCKRERELQSLVDAGTLSAEENSQAENELACTQECIEDHYENMRADEHKFKAMSEDHYKQVVDAHQELIELKNLVRQHTPQLLEFVPDVDFGVCSESEFDFFGNPPEVDHSLLCRDLRKLEGQARVLTLGVKVDDQKKTSKGALPFTDTQLEAVRGVIQKNPGMKTADIKSQLARAGGTSIGNDKLQKFLDHIRVNFPGEYTVSARLRRTNH